MKSIFNKISTNIFPGFIVSLVALPLAMGLAIASGMPPIAGLITSAVGGIMLAILGGSHVTISGPGNGMVVVTLAGITLLGNGDMQQGYLLTLAAVVVSGGVVFLFGLLRFGGLSDYFPSSALQGLLAAIGLIIMAKQLHVMLGEMNPAGNTTWQYLMSFPESVLQVLQGQKSLHVYGLGVFSLFFLFYHRRIPYLLVRKIPAPIWVIATGIVYTALSQKLSLLPGLAPQYLVDLPEQAWKNLVHPDFSQVATFDFWGVVFMLTFIGALESLLSIKAIDKLDPLHRRSNVNKDLRALGLASIASGLIGGMNVVTVIARSSVNVNNGATYRFSNFFHGLFLVLFILFLSPYLQLIPLPTLAAILVYTGYKLISPAVFKKVYAVGWEQLLIFIITLVATLATNLLAGITIGVLATLLTQIKAIGGIQSFIENMLRPNTLLLQEKDDRYVLSARGYSNFLNFTGVKKKLDTVPQEAELILDFSLSHFVDYTVLEQLQGYYRSFRSRGGQLEIIGLDTMGAFSNHQLAPRRPFLQKHTGNADATHRQKSMRLFAKKMGWTFDRAVWFTPVDFDHFQYFSTRIIDSTSNHIVGKVNNISILLADVHYHAGEYAARQSFHSTMVKLALPQMIPQFVLDRENLLDRVAALAGYRDINFARHPDFSHRFKLKGEDEKAVHQFFDNDLIDFFESNIELHLESDGSSILIFEKERLCTIREIKLLVNFAFRLSQVLHAKFSK